MEARQLAVALFSSQRQTWTNIVEMSEKKWLPLFRRVKIAKAPWSFFADHNVQVLVTSVVTSTPL